MYTIASLGNHELPPELAKAADDDVERTLRRAASFLGWGDVEIAARSSVLGGSCVACVDFVAIVRGTVVLVARPDFA